MRFRLSPEWKRGAIVRAAAIKKTARDYNPFAPMIYRTAHITDCARHMLAALPVALAVGGLIFLSQLLADAAANALPLAALGQFLALAVVKYIPQLLTASLFVGVMLAFGRAFQTREMAAWFAAGAGLRHFVLPGALFALPSIVLVAIFSVSVSPWAVRAAADLRARLLHDINPESLRPGEFGVAPGGAYTYFIGDERDSDGNILSSATAKTPTKSSSPRPPAKTAKAANLSPCKTESSTAFRVWPSRRALPKSPPLRRCKFIFPPPKTFPFVRAAARLRICGGTTTGSAPNGFGESISRWRRCF